MSIKNFFRPFAPAWLLDFYHLKLGILAAYCYGFPARKLKVIGITGTNGKTTTAYLTHAIFQEAGQKTALATTVAFAIGERFTRNNQKMTTLSPFALQAFLRQAVRAGCSRVVIEVTSHALVQHRVWGINFDTVALTNITHDHLDYHQTFADYRAAKLQLFQSLPRVSVSNLDDLSGALFAQQKANIALTYALDQKADITARKIIASTTKTEFTAILPEGQLTINLPLAGKFNLSNALAAVAIALGSDIPNRAIASALEKFSGVPGRMEQVKLGQDFEVIIDYAHTPDALEKIFAVLVPTCKGRIIHVFGATGTRDTTKRPILGAISGRQADISIVTDEDPYHEDPLAIIQQVAAGVPKGATRQKPKIKNETFFVQPDRRTAIASALALARRNDIVLITGKGHEQVMAVADSRANHGYKLIPWNERKIVQEELEKLTTTSV